MASVSIQEAREALDTARFAGDVKRIGAAKLVLTQLIAEQQTPTETDYRECQQKLAAD
jgi:hypothetical protein